jgi:hypothetical protein
VGHYGLKIKSGKAFKHFINVGFKNGLNPNPLVSLWWMKENIGINSFDDFILCLNNDKKSHPFFDIELFNQQNDAWRYYANNAKENKLNPCSELSFDQLISLSGLQNIHFINIILILGEEYHNFLRGNHFKESKYTRHLFISQF